MKYRLAVPAVLVALLLHDIFYIVLWLQGAAQPPFGDFFGYWANGRAMSAGVPVYDYLAVREFQLGLAPGLPGFYPFLYPPFFLVLLVPLSHLALVPAYTVWIGLTLALYLALVAGRKIWSAYGAALLVAPTTVLTIVAGQNGFLSAALLAGGLRLLQRRPVVSGVLFGLLIYKPQLGVLVPVALLAGRSWRALASTCATAVVMVLATCAAFGAGIWPAWLGSIGTYGTLIGDNQHLFDRIMPILAASVRSVGGPVALAFSLQAILGVAVAVVVWRAFARGDTPRAVVLTLVGTVVATPYLFLYDLPILTAGLVLEAQRRQSQGLETWLTEIALVVLAYAFAMLTAKFDAPFVMPALLGLIFAVIAARNAAPAPRIA